MSKSIKDFFILRLPKGDLYERKRKTKELLEKAKKSNYTELVAFAKYLNASTTDVYYRGGKHFGESLQLMDKYLNVENGMIMLGGVKIPKPDFNELYLFEYEFYDLLMPFLISEYDSSYDMFYHEGPYEINSQLAIGERDIVIDCGANMGYFSAIASKKAKLGKVYAFEPFKNVIERYLNRTILYNSNIEIVQSALSDKIGEMNIYIDDNNIGASSLVLNCNKQKLEKVGVTTIDEWVKKNNIPYVSYIKADIEGAEREMLRGAKWVLKEYSPKLSICTYHLPDDPQVLENIIKEANSNYIVKHVYKKLYAYCPE